MTTPIPTALRLAAATLCLGLLACGPSESPPAPDANTPEATAPPTTPPETAPAPPVAPPPEAGPPANDAALGQSSYATYCASCHGTDGRAQTPMADALDPRPTAHSDGSYMNGLSDDYLFRIIQQGGAAVGKSPLMAPWGGTLSDAEIRQVVAFIRSLADPPYQPPTP